MKPALTPEEWADVQKYGPHPDYLVAECGPLTFTIIDDVETGRLQVGALALLGYFKAADVDRLRELHDYTPGSDIQEWMLDLADRIEALLPPET